MKVKTFNYVIACRAYAYYPKTDALALFEYCSEFAKWVEKIFNLFCSISATEHSLKNLSFNACGPHLYTYHELILEAWNIAGSNGWGWFKSLSVDEDKLIKTSGKTISVSNWGVSWNLFSEYARTHYRSDYVSFEKLRSCISPVQMLIERHKLQ